MWNIVAVVALLCYKYPAWVFKYYKAAAPAGFPAPIRSRFPAGAAALYELTFFS